MITLIFQLPAELTTKIDTIKEIIREKKPEIMMVNELNLKSDDDQAVDIYHLPTYLDHYTDFNEKFYLLMSNLRMLLLQNLESGFEMCEPS